MLYGDLPEVKLEGVEQPVRGFTFRVPNPPKTAILRLPTPAEMTDRLSKQKSIRRTLGRRKSQTEYLPNPKADLELFNKIKVGGEAFDEFEAGNAVGKLTRNEVMSCERVGDEYRITVNTPFGDTVHHLAIPTARDITLYRRSAMTSVDLPHGQEELRYPVEPAVALYDATIKSFEGYADGYKKEDIPPHHKSSVVVELANAIDELDADLDPNS